MTRILYRRYLRDEISEEEWEYRKRQPYRTFGPLNLRPYLDKEWFEKGGGGEFVLSISIFAYQLPFMTLGQTEQLQCHERDLSGGAPPFSDLLTFDRFLHRARLVKKQAKAFFGHPLLFEFIHAASLAYAQYTYHCALQWTKHAEGANGTGLSRNSDEELLTAMDVPSVTAHGGSSIGNVRPSTTHRSLSHSYFRHITQLGLIFPTEYPLPSSHPLSPFSPISHSSRAGYAAPHSLEVDTTPKIVMENVHTHLYTHPAELYLGAFTSRGELCMFVHYDRNVYEDEVVKEWLDEVKGAVMWYLGQSHQSRHDALQA